MRGDAAMLTSPNLSLFFLHCSFSLPSSVCLIGMMMIARIQKERKENRRRKGKALVLRVCVLGGCISGLSKEKLMNRQRSVREENSTAWWLCVAFAHLKNVGTMTDRGGRMTKKTCCVMMCGGLVWSSTQHTFYLSLRVLQMLGMTWGRRRGSFSRLCPSIASEAWPRPPRIAPTAESPSAPPTTSRSICGYTQVSTSTNPSQPLLQSAFLYQLNMYCTSCKMYSTRCTDNPSGVRLTYWFMSSGLIKYWSQSASHMIDMMQMKSLGIGFVIDTALVALNLILSLMPDTH